MKPRVEIFSLILCNKFSSIYWLFPLLIILLTWPTFMWISGWIRSSSYLCTPFPNVYNMQNKVIIVRIQPRKCWIKWNKKFFSLCSALLQKGLFHGQHGTKAFFFFGAHLVQLVLCGMSRGKITLARDSQSAREGGVWRQIYENFTGDEEDMGCAQGDLVWGQRTPFPLSCVLCRSNLLPRTTQEQS